MIVTPEQTRGGKENINNCCLCFGIMVHANDLELALHKKMIAIAFVCAALIIEHLAYYQRNNYLKL